MACVGSGDGVGVGMRLMSGVILVDEESELAASRLLLLFNRRFASTSRDFSSAISFSSSASLCFKKVVSILY